MAQEAGKSRPLHLSDVQIKELASGRKPDFGEHSRPRAMTAKHIESLAKGEHVDFDKLPMLSRVEGRESAMEQIAGVRPQVLADKDIHALREGKDIGLEKRDRLKSQSH